MKLGKIPCENRVKKREEKRMSGGDRGMFAVSKGYN